MNERIMSLANQAGLKFPSEDKMSPVEEKFAELIVRECAAIAGDAYGQRGGVYYDNLGEAIKEHFGVEE